MAQRKLLLHGQRLQLTLERLALQLAEDPAGLADMCLVGLQPRGVYVSDHIHALLERHTARAIPYGKLDITFFRDDIRGRGDILKANQTDIPFVTEGRRIVLIDDVLFTGRSVRAALDALNAFGRPAIVELLVLVNRRYTQELPIAPTYIGLEVDSIWQQRVVVEWAQAGAQQDAVYLINQTES
jgi:pyrimidine operon attenuation protein / uracil phosphoribosyltransferase